MSAALSNADLPWFFDAAHGPLAERFVAAGQALADDHEARRVAERLGEELGLYDLLIPPGEARLDLRALCLLREALGYHAPLADALFAVHGLGLVTLWRGGSEAQRERFGARARRGETIFAFALTEPEAGSDVASLRTTARPEGDGWILDGDKTLISSVGVADAYVVFANADPAAGKRGISAFLVEAGAAGLAATALPMSVDHPIGALQLDGVRGELLGAVGDGLKLALGTLDTFRVTVGAAAVGMARRALDESLARCKARVQFGQPLAAQPLIQTQLAEMATELDAARLLVLRAAYQKDHGVDRNPREVAMAKLFATESAQRIIDRAVQLHGGLGVQRGSVVERLYREVRPLRIYEGTSEIQLLLIGKSLVHPGGEPR